MRIPLDICSSYIEAHSRIAATRTKPELPVLTISRETGAGAITIAGMVAEQLNMHRNGQDHRSWTVFDENLVEKVLEDHNLPTTTKKFISEDGSSFDLTSVVEELLELHPSDWTLVQHTTDTIFRLARLGNVILVGRGANIITANFENAVHIRLVAPLDVRIRHIAKYYRLTEQEAATFVSEKDGARRRYVEINFGTAIEDPLQYDITVNTDRMPFEETAQMIAAGVVRLSLREKISPPKAIAGMSIGE